MEDTNESMPAGVRRRTVLIGAATGVLATGSAALGGTAAHAAPDSADDADGSRSRAGQRVVYNLNVDWKFIQQDLAGAQAESFDESAWTTVSVPHTFNDVDSFDEFITRNGEASIARQSVWYRKHFTLPERFADRKVLIEFEGIRQSATVYLNGTEIGLYEYGVTPFGYDITAAVKFGADNVIAVRADNSYAYQEKATGANFQWESKDFNPNFGGLTRNVRLYVLPRTYFTLPLFTNLGTTGTYVYPSDISVADRTATVTAEAQVRNEHTDIRVITVSANIRNARGRIVRTLRGQPVTLGPGQTQTIPVSGQVRDLRFWEPGNPHLYTVEMVLSDGGRVRDVYPIRTGFRKAEFRGGTVDGGVYINEKFTWLTGYAHRAVNEWAVIGGAVPEWMRDFDGELIRASEANLMRWMHISASPANIRMTDKHGIVSIQPAGDKEKDAVGRQWEHRVEVMRDSMIYFRNSPSILFWEAGNNAISAEHMQQMTELRKTWDPHGMRAMGCRALSADPAAGDTAAVDAAEYVGTMLNRHYTDYARDRVPIIESEYTRDEAPRRVWDEHSPPDFGYKVGPEVTWNWDSEEFAGQVAASTRYEFWGQRIHGPGERRYSGAAALIWADSNQHGRQYGWECARLSGRVDAVRIPKESFYTYRVMQNPRPDIHIIGHWTYPADTRKTMYVMASHVTRVQLLVNDVPVGDNRGPEYDFLFAFPDVAWEAGTITAVGYDATGAEVVRTAKQTTGPAAALKLTPHTAPGGLRADGADILMIDVEVVDAQGRRVPTDQARVDFTLTGPGRFLGGFNPGREHSVHQSYVDTECGINRVFVRAARVAGAITVQATREGLTAGSVTVAASPFAVTDGMTTRPPD
ncbi:MAG TPA: glycoside hydrolase family 2 TIM barrel-domain containing protein [Micromonosporaceae bacterium]|nr:glycoside hydrolase family 2 TIM barrel-domain containing protein [Micromonosporaceae bacterium]